MRTTALKFIAALTIVTIELAARADVAVDLSGYKPESGIDVKRDGERLTVAWPMAEGEVGRLTFALRTEEPRLLSLGTSRTSTGPADPVLEAVEPITFLTVGTRVAPGGRPPERSIFDVFFDSPAKREYQTYRSRLDLKRASVTSQGRRATITLGDLSMGPFRGTLEVTVYSGGRLVHVEAVVSTDEDARAILYDAGLVGGAAGWTKAAWRDMLGQSHTEAFTPQTADHAIAALHRVLAVDGRSGSLACFPPPHQFFFPRDLTDNLDYLWLGKGHRALADEAGFGIRQSESGGGNFVPWFNAPPGTAQRLGVFYLLTRQSATDALAEVDKYTHGDRFPDLPGYLKFTSHLHMAIAMDALQRKERGDPQITPDFVNMFRQMGVNMVHLAEFHGDGHPRDPGPLRLAELDSMFSECQRLSSENLLFIPGEEANVYFGLNEPGKHPGHWLYLFPRPVAWIMRRSPDQPFAEPNPKYGTLYHVGSRDDLSKLMKQEHGLAWTAHPRIKASNWTPDIFRNEDFYLADFWLGGAWKAMPADLSRERLGERVLDLLSDMDNWGQKKYVVGEVDVFKLNKTHELYGHMNINYVKLVRVPKYEEGWQPLLDALRGGRFFVTTGEVLVRDFSVGGKSSGETLALATTERPEVRAALDWTFPLRFAELVSGDGHKVYRERIDLTDTAPFGQRTLVLHPDLSGRTWVRLEAWDAATNGAFTQPVWLNSALSKSP
jgi:hypothetical protein